MADRDIESGNGNPSKFYITANPYEKQWTSWLVQMIVVANTAVFIVSLYINNCPKNHLGFEGQCFAKFLGRMSFEPLKDNNMFGTSVYTLDKMGALNVDKVVYEHESWRLFTSFWLHAGVIHLLLNMLGLLCFGIRLEQQFGFARVGVIYILSGLGCSIMSSLFIEYDVIAMGASGAVIGLFAAMLSELLANWTIYSNRVSSMISLIFIIAFTFALGFIPLFEADNLGHMGGGVTGFLLGFIFLLRPQLGWAPESPNLPASAQVSKYSIRQYILWLTALLLLITWFTLGPVMMYKRV